LCPGGDVIRPNCRHLARGCFPPAAGTARNQGGSQSRHPTNRNFMSPPHNTAEPADCQRSQGRAAGYFSSDWNDLHSAALRWWIEARARLGRSGRFFHLLRHGVMSWRGRSAGPGAHTGRSGFPAGGPCRKFAAVGDRIRRAEKIEALYFGARASATRENSPRILSSGSDFADQYPRGCAVSSTRPKWDRLNF